MVCYTAPSDLKIISYQTVFQISQRELENVSIENGGELPTSNPSGLPTNEWSCVVLPKIKSASVDQSSLFF